MKAINNNFGRKAWPIASPLLASVLTVTWVSLSSAGTALAGEIRDPPKFVSPEDYSSAKHWNLKGENLSPIGHNPLYFPLRPDHKFIMERPDSPDGHFRKEVIVLDETEPFDIPGIGKFEAAVVQEEEFSEGRYTQQVLKWFAIDKTTNSVYAFGEISWEIDEDGDKVFDGTWRAGESDDKGVAEPGLMMPGTFKLGARYISQGSKGEAFGGSENIEVDVSITTPAGKFEKCVRVREQDLLDREDITDKIWCPGVGIVFDTSDGKLVASDVIPGSDTSSFGKIHGQPPPESVPSVAMISGDQATKIALKEVPGEVTSVVIERKRQKNVYVVEILAASDGVETDVFVDIETGEVVGTDR